MRNKLLLVSALGATLGAGLDRCAFAAGADDFVKESIPSRWITPHLPEDLDKLEYPAYYKDLDKARLESFTGRYKLSLITLDKAKGADPLQAALIRANSLTALGRRDEALQTLSEPAAVAENTKAQIQKARVLAGLTRYDEAIELLKKVIAREKDSVAAHYHLGEIYETAGKLDEARAAYEFFKPYIDKLSAEEFDNAEELTLIGRGLDRWATVNAEYRTRLPLHNMILERCFGRAFLTLDRDYWPAKVAAAEFHVARDDDKTAMELLKSVAGQNPNDVRTLVLLGTLSLKQFNFDGAEHAIDAIRKVDADSVEADVLETRNLLQQRRPKDAERVVRRVIDRQPRNIEAMGLLAAVYALQLREEPMQAVLKKVEELDPDNAQAYLEVAEQLSAMRQYPRSAAMYKVAIERAPWWIDARNGLGLLYTQSGDEDDAYRVLEEAKLFDPFNVATNNYLKLLDDYRKYEKVETPHFVIAFDKTIDPVIPIYFGEYLESIYKDVTGAFRHEPDKKTFIEVFPTHDAFSVRTTGSPWIGTVGASTGRVIAMVAPRKGKQTMGAYNWAQVLRHEFTHTVTLAATDNRIAHWMTEGLAVFEERTPLRWEWVPMLYNAVKKKQLFTMENLTWGFVRPKKPSDRQLAYAQSYWICKYIEETFGHDKMLAMLAEFRKGREQGDVFPDVLGKSLAQFQADFFAWTEKEVSTWGYDDEKTEKYKKLVKEAEAMVKARQYDEALKLWQQVIELRPMDPLPHQRLAGLYLVTKQPEKAVGHLVRLHQVELHENNYAKRVARVYRDMDQMDKAVEYGLQAVYVDPYDTSAHELLAELYEKAGNAEGAQRERKTIAILEEWAKQGTTEAERATNPG